MNWKLSNVLMEIVDLIAAIRTNLTPETKAARCAILDNRLENIATEAPPVWSYERVVALPEHRKGMFPDDSPPLYDTYPNRAIMQTWNVLRLLRILLYEELDSHRPMPALASASHQTPSFIKPTLQQICATVPHITNCSLFASHRLPPGSSCQHSFTSAISKSTTHNTAHPQCFHTHLPALRRCVVALLYSIDPRLDT